VADVFVSYARADAPQARKIAEILKAAGYEVWWDSELLPHHAFAQSIEKEVRAARAVIVVWSEHALESQWVRAEADLARSQGKLVQVSIDHCALPLPFNQYQTADLRAWKGDPADPRWLKVLASLAQLTHRPAEAANPARSFSPASALGSGARRGIILAAAAAVAFLALGGLWLAWSMFQAPVRGSRIAVRPYETIGGTPALHDFAAGLSDSLRATLNQDRFPTVSSADAQTLQGPDLPAKLKAMDVGLVLNGTVQAQGDQVTVRTYLEDPAHHATLWSADVSGASGQLQPVQAQIGARTVAVLHCAARGLDPKGGIAEAEVLALFLHACDLLEIPEASGEGAKRAYALLDAFREVTRRAPRFAAGHAMFAEHEADRLDFFPGQEAAMRQEAAHEAKIALELDPNDPDADVTFSLLAPRLDFAQREMWLRKALAVDPSWHHANGTLGYLLESLGRLDEAVLAEQRAVSVNPTNQYWSLADIGALIADGDTRQADMEIARVSQIWPQLGPELWQTQLDSLIAQKRWADALTHMDAAGAFPQLASELPLKRLRAELEALNTQNPAALAERRQFDLTKLAGVPSQAIESLSLLGFVDDAFAIAQHYNPVSADGVESPDFLFRPETVALRRDPRFMALANKWGLPQYWRATGKWPDFCAAPDLPYNCQAEAAKLKPVVTASPRSH
jgi:TolB-like protein/tetratricopeptide (TPR) repeat protein